jgi:Zn finger protein HypA/HybF involved in hydrogenase expression
MADNPVAKKQSHRNVKTASSVKEVHRIPVTYLCWNCGSSVNKYEATELPITNKEVWNICPQCRAMNKR